MGKLKALAFFLVVAATFYVAWNLIPPYFHNSQFQEDLDDIARRATYTAVNDEDLKQTVVHKAQSMDIVLKQDQVTVTRSGNGIGISVQYRVHVDMIVHPVDLDFTTNSLNKRIY
jgi:hypothetical protein